MTARSIGVNRMVNTSSVCYYVSLTARVTLVCTDRQGFHLNVSVSVVRLRLLITKRLHRISLSVSCVLGSDVIALLSCMGSSLHSLRLLLEADICTCAVVEICCGILYVCRYRDMLWY